MIWQDHAAPDSIRSVPIPDLELLVRPGFLVNIASRLAVSALLFAAASCTSVPPSPAPAASASGNAVGTVLAVRPIPVTLAAGSDDGAWRGVLLAGATGPDAARPSSEAPLAEFIVRADGGSTVSIVQANAAGLLVGSRVAIVARPAVAGRVSIARLP
jgi:hypothetical protein